MSSPLVSIIIPAYNSEAYLKETIQSALDQTWPEKEIIVVDDGSADNSLNVAKAFRDNRVKVFSQKNQGASAARNRGLRESSGDYIQFLDGDDLFHESKIEHQLKHIAGIPYAMAYGPIGYFSNSNSLHGVNLETALKKDFDNGYDCLFALYGGYDTNYAGGMVPLHAWLTPRQLIVEAGPWDESISVDDDGEFFCRVVLKAEQIKYVANAVGYYRKHTHNKNLSSQKSYKAYLSAFNAIKLKYQHLGNNKGMNALLANQAMHVLNDLYPREPKLCKEIQQFINQLGGNNWQPYQEGVHKWLRILFGWRLVKMLSYYKNKR
jgi:glycosyltransferase involved in cell wall biosynthesis